MVKSTSQHGHLPSSNRNPRSAQHRYSRQFLTGTLITLILCFFYLQQLGIRFYNTRISACSDDTDILLPVEDLAAAHATLCKPLGLKPYFRGRRIYDAFVFSHELDLLEIRLMTHAAHVDYFVIVESRYTPTGNKKPLFLEQNWDRFREFHGMIIHHVVDTLPTTDSRENEKSLRNALLTQVFPVLEASRQARQDDVLLVSETDEIVRPDTLYTLKHCAIPERTSLQSVAFLYSAQWRRNKVWNHPQATTFGKDIAHTLLPHDLRFSLPAPSSLTSVIKSQRPEASIPHASWRCHMCHPSIAAVRFDLGSRISASEYNSSSTHSDNDILNAVRNAGRLVPLDFAKATEGDNVSYTLDDNNYDVPGYILSQNGGRQRFKYLLHNDQRGDRFNEGENLNGDFEWTLNGF